MYGRTFLCNILIFASCFVQAIHPVHNLHEARESGKCRSINFQYPHGCSDGACDFTVQWVVGSDLRVNFSLTAVVSNTSLVWIAAGFSQDRKKVDTAVCSLDKDAIPSIHTAYSNHGMSDLTLSHQEHSDLMLKDIKINNDTMTCIFSRPIKSDNVSLSEPVYVLVASGTSKIGNSSACDLHTSKEGGSECKLDVTRCAESGAECVESVMRHHHCDWFQMLLLKLHGVVMTIVFVLLLPTAAMIARYYRMVFPGSWFTAHRSLMVISVMWILIGFAFVLGHTKGGFYFGTHQMVGITCICLSLVQPVYGFLRPPVGLPQKRKVFNLVHRTLGITIIALGTLALFLGSYIIKENSTWMIVVLVLSVLVTIGFIALLEYLTRKNKIHMPPVGYHKVTKDELSESEEEVFVKEGVGVGKGTRAGEKEQVPMFRMEKAILVVFVLQGFIFSGVIGMFLFHTEPQDHSVDRP